MKTTHIVTALLISWGSLQAECTILTSPAADTTSLKGSDTLALTISNIYYKKNKKGKKVMEFKTGSEALLEFDGKARDFIHENCKKYNLQVVYNYRIQSFSDKNWYTFYATYDYR